VFCIVLGALLAVGECVDLVGLFYALIGSDLIGAAGDEVKATLPVFAGRELAMLLVSCALAAVGIVLKARLRWARIAAMTLVMLPIVARRKFGESLVR
jgi:hypothetical protein